MLRYRTILCSGKSFVFSKELFIPFISLQSSLNQLCILLIRSLPCMRFNFDFVASLLLLDCFALLLCLFYLLTVSITAYSFVPLLDNTYGISEDTMQYGHYILNIDFLHWEFSMFSANLWCCICHNWICGTV